MLRFLRSSFSALFLQSQVPRVKRRALCGQADDGDTDDQSELARSEASTSAAWGPSQHHNTGSKRARMLQRAVQEQRREDRFCLTEDKLKAKMAEDDSSPAHNLRSHASRSPQPAARVSPAAIRSPHREPAQTKMVSFAVQTRAPGVRKPCTTPESYVKQVIDNGDGADLLRVSCALGFLLSADGAVSEPHEAMSYIDDAVLAATRSFRCIASDLQAKAEELLAAGEGSAEALLQLVLVDGLGGIRNARRFQRGTSQSSFLYHEVAAQEGPALDSFARACFCVCMWTFLRESLSDSPSRKPSMQIRCSPDNPEEFWVAIRYSARGSWRYFCTTEKPLGAREESSGAVSPLQPLQPLHLIGVVFQRFWATALASSSPTKRSAAARSTTTGFCSKWLCLVLELDREKELGLARSLAFVLSIRAGLEQSRVASSCLPELQALIARHAAERPEVPVSPLRGAGSHSAEYGRDSELWTAYAALSTIVNMSGGAAGGPGSGGGRMSTEAVMGAAERVGQSADIVMARASSALRQRRPAPGGPQATQGR